MPSFSSVIRKPGQKIQPRAPRKNVQRNLNRPVAPPSLTPESQTVSPAVEPLDTVEESQPSEVPPSSDRHEIPSISPSVIPSIAPSVERPREPSDQGARDGETTTPRVPQIVVEVSAPSSRSVGVQIIHPVETSQRTRNAIPDIIPSISITSPAAQKRKATNEPTPTPSEEPVHPIEESRKRRKTTSTVDEGEDSASRTSRPPEPVLLILRTSLRHRRSESRTSDALLQDATTQAAAVSELANDIENRARSMRVRSERRSTSQAGEAQESTVENSIQPRAKGRKSKRKSKSDKIQALAQQVVDAAVSGRKDKDGTSGQGRSRLTTPENAEELEIDPEEVSMSALTTDIKIGRKSETEKRMQENWADIKERRKAEVEKRREAAQKKNSSKNRDGEGVAEEVAVPKQIIVNGVIVVANESREVAFGAGLEEAVRENADVAIEDDRIYKYVNQSTLGKNAGRDKRSKWDDETTNLFYQGLRMFGTDFAMIANLFPESVDRAIVKKKYIAELQLDPTRVEKCIATKETVDLDEYAAMANMEFEDPDKLMKELEEEEKRMREEDEKRRADQGYVMNDNEADIPLPSTETDQGDEGELDATLDAEEVDADDDEATPAPARRLQAPSTARSERANALADKIVQAAVASKKKQPRRKRESTGAGRGGRGGRKGKRAVEGLEERIGPLDDFEH